MAIPEKLFSFHCFPDGCFHNHLSLLCFHILPCPLMVSCNTVSKTMSLLHKACLHVFLSVFILHSVWHYGFSEYARDFSLCLVILSFHRISCICLIILSCLDLILYCSVWSNIHIALFTCIFKVEIFLSYYILSKKILYFNNEMYHNCFYKIWSLCYHNCMCLKNQFTHCIIMYVLQYKGWHCYNVFIQNHHHKGWDIVYHLAIYGHYSRPHR